MGQLARALRVHGENGARLGRLLRERRALGGAGGPTIGIDEVIADVGGKLGRLSRHIDERWPELDSESVGAVGQAGDGICQNAVRLGRLLRVQRALHEESFSDELDSAINAALDSLGEEWGIEL